MTDENTDMQHEPNGEALPSSEGRSGESDLDSLLAEFEQGQQRQQRPSQKPATATRPTDGNVKQGRPNDTTLNSLAPVIQFAAGEMTRRAEEELKVDLDNAISFIQEADELKGAPSKLIRGLAEAYAQEDPDFGAAFQNRKADAKAWDRALSNAREWAIETVKEWPGNTVRSEVEAAVTSARKTSTRQPESEGPSPSKMAKMSDQEWSEYLGELQEGAAQS